jgi:uncharacterized membrane protein
MALNVHQRAATAIVAGYVAGAVAYFMLPAVQSGMNGAPPPSARPLGTLMLPTAAAITYSLLRSVSRRDPYMAPEATATRTLDVIVFRIILFMIGLHALVLAGLLGAGSLAGRSVPVLLGAGLIAVGNLLPRTRPNLAIGIRTARTLNDRSAWMRTNRVAGHVAVALGAAIALSALLPFWPRAYMISAAALVAFCVLVAWCWNDARV